MTERTIQGYTESDIRGPDKDPHYYARYGGYYCTTADCGMGYCKRAAARMEYRCRMCRGKLRPHRSKPGTPVVRGPALTGKQLGLGL